MIPLIVEKAFVQKTFKKSRRFIAENCDYNPASVPAAKESSNRRRNGLGHSDVDVFGDECVSDMDRQCATRAHDQVAKSTTKARGSSKRVLQIGITLAHGVLCA